MSKTGLRQAWLGVQALGPHLWVRGLAEGVLLVGLGLLLAAAQRCGSIASGSVELTVKRQHSGVVEQ